MWTLSRDLGFWQLLRDDELPAADGFETWGLNGDYAVGCAAGGDNGGLIACRPAQFGAGGLQQQVVQKPSGTGVVNCHRIILFRSLCQKLNQWYDGNCAIVRPV
jgi:hypothetical protein